MPHPCHTDMHERTQKDKKEPDAFVVHLFMHPHVTAKHSDGCPPSKRREEEEEEEAGEEEGCLEQSH